VTATALHTARCVLLDFRWPHPTAWCYWQVMDPIAGWGLIRYDGGTLRAGAVETKFYVPAQFTRHIRPRMRVLDTGSELAVAAYDSTARQDTRLDGKLLRVPFSAGQVQTFQIDGVVV
jgi:galactan endo-1,6-beta-galactosidase